MEMKPNSPRSAMKFYPMPTDDIELEKMIDQAEENFRNGKYLSPKEAREKAKKWGKSNKSPIDL